MLSILIAGVRVGYPNMATEQLLLRLPGDLVRRFKQDVPARECSAFVRQLLEQALPSAVGDNDPHYLTALAVEQDTVLGNEMAEWEVATINDGLTETPAPDRHG